MMKTLIHSLLLTAVALACAGATIVIRGPVIAPAAGTAWTTAFTLGTARNNYTGEVGMTIETAGASVTVTHLGRTRFSGNSGSHTLKIVNTATGAVLASVTVDMSTGTVGQFVYGELSSPYVLSASTFYSLLSTETSGGDSWSDADGANPTGTAVATYFSCAYRANDTDPPSPVAAPPFGQIDFKYQ